MSGYKDGEALWLTRLQAMPEFDAQNSARGHWGLMNKGKADHYAIIKPGAWERTKISRHTRLDRYQTIIQLWQRYKEDGSSLVDLEGLVASTLTELDKYRVMGDTSSNIIQANIIAVREVIEVRSSPADGPSWLYVELVGEWHEEIDISYAE